MILDPGSARSLKHALVEGGKALFGSNTHASFDESAIAPYDVIVTDICMARMNGDELCRRLRQEGVSIPMVAVTGNCTPLEIEELSLAGFDAIVGKPFSEQDLDTAIRRVIC